MAQQAAMAYGGGPMTQSGGFGAGQSAFGGGGSPRDSNMLAQLFGRGGAPMRNPQGGVIPQPHTNQMPVGAQQANAGGMQQQLLQLQQAQQRRQQMQAMMQLQQLFAQGRGPKGTGVAMPQGQGGTRPISGGAPRQGPNVSSSFLPPAADQIGGLGGVAQPGPGGGGFTPPVYAPQRPPPPGSSAPLPPTQAELIRQDQAAQIGMDWGGNAQAQFLAGRPLSEIIQMAR